MIDQNYLLEVGHKGQKRLEALNSLYNKKTQSFLLKNGLKPGIRILEIGGGIGSISFWLAEKVGPQGHVIVIDSSQEQIDIMENIKNKNYIKNVTIKKHNAENINSDLGKFDLIFCRFLLIHLTDPIKVIEKIMQILKKGGIFICEDCIFSNSFCYPALPAFDKRIELIRSLFHASNKNADLGKYLYNMMYKLKFENIKMNLSQPVLTTKSEKFIIPQFLNETKDKIIDFKLANKDDINLIISQLIKHLVLSPEHIVASAQVCQVRGIKK